MRRLLLIENVIQTDKCLILTEEHPLVVRALDGGSTITTPKGRAVLHFGRFYYQKQVESYLRDATNEMELAFNLSIQRADECRLLLLSFPLYMHIASVADKWNIDHVEGKWTQLDRAVQKEKLVEISARPESWRPYEETEDGGFVDWQGDFGQDECLDGEINAGTLLWAKGDDGQPTLDEPDPHVWLVRIEKNLPVGTIAALVRDYTRRRGTLTFSVLESEGIEMFPVTSFLVDPFTGIPSSSLWRPRHFLELTSNKDYSTLPNNCVTVTAEARAQAIQAAAYWIVTVPERANVGKLHAVPSALWQAHTWHATLIGKPKHAEFFAQSRSTAPSKRSRHCLPLWDRSVRRRRGRRVWVDDRAARNTVVEDTQNLVRESDLGEIAIGMMDAYSEVFEERNVDELKIWRRKFTGWIQEDPKTRAPNQSYYALKFRNQGRVEFSDLLSQGSG
ncbi:hypothetical protein HK104_010015 [Borealophlyctis nickersoniae]|nr:hypothetical protein HK104_010015 [Borealophlyctis nickersoniae]